MVVQLDPDPVAAPVAAEVDAAERTVTVWPVEFRSQATRVWADALMDLAEAEETGDWTYASPVWAYAGGRRVARGVPDCEALQFRFDRGDPVFGELVATPRLSATLVVDRSRARIMFVKFRGRRS
jgi:hypothetical protein